MSKVGIETVTVDSSLVSVMTYARAAKMLYVTFKNGTIYLYNKIAKVNYKNCMFKNHVRSVLGIQF